MEPVGHLEIKKQIMMNGAVLGEDFVGKKVSKYILESLGKPKTDFG